MVFQSVGRPYSPLRTTPSERLEVKIDYSKDYKTCAHFSHVELLRSDVGLRFAPELSVVLYGLWSPSQWGHHSVPRRTTPNERLEVKLIGLNGVKYVTYITPEGLNSFTLCPHTTNSLYGYLEMV